MGELQLSPKKFWKLTPAEFDAMVRGYFRRLEDQEEAIRKLATVLVNLNRAPDHPGYEPADIWPLRKDPPYVPPAPLTAEEQAAQDARIDAMDADLL